MSGATISMLFFKREEITYHVVLDPVHLGVRHIRPGNGLVQPVLDPVDPEDTNLLEGPASDPLGELAVVRLHLLLLADLGDLGVEPLVAQHLGRADDRQPSRVPGLRARDEGQLRAGAEQLVRGQGLGLLLGVVEVGRRGGTDDGRQQRAGAEEDAGAAREGDRGVGRGARGEEVGDVVARRTGDGQEEDVVGVGSGDDVVVEVVHYQARAFGGEGNVELGEEGDERGRGGGVGGEGQEDVALLVEELEEEVRCKVGTEAWGEG